MTPTKSVLAMDSILADQVFDVLVAEAGARDDDRLVNRAQFVIAQSEGCDEWRFGGYLGFGGKFRHNPFSSAHQGGIYVDCYPEDLNDHRREVIARTNEALRKLALRHDADRRNAA